MQIYLDVDGVVRDLKTRFSASEYFKGTLPQSYGDPDFGKYIKKMWESPQTIKKMLHTEAPVIKGSLEWFYGLHKALPEANIQFLTANGFNEDCKHATVLFLLENGFMTGKALDDIIFTNSGDKKLEVLAKRPGILIDDNIDTLTKIQEPSLGIWVEDGYTQDREKYQAWDTKYKIAVPNLASLPYEQIRALAVNSGSVSILEQFLKGAPV